MDEAAKILMARLEAGYALPPLSAVALKLLELASDEDASLDDVVMLIERDPSLSVRLLNLANSAFLGRGRPSATIAHAVMRLGFNTVRVMVLSISLRGAFPLGKVEEFDYELFWRVSLYRAIIARSLAQKSRLFNPDEAFLAGLTSEIGLPILFDLFIKGKTWPFPLDLEPLEELLEKEKAHFGVDHRQVGAAALKYWKIPGQIVDCQTYFGEKARLHGPASMGAISNLARLFSRILLKHPGAFRAFYAMAEKLLGVHREDVHEIVLDSFAQVEDIARGLELEINKDKDLLDVMDKANKALERISRELAQHREMLPPETLPSFGTINKCEKSVSNTLEAVAHEIRNPLTAVGGFARRLLISLDPDSQAGLYARMILEEAQRLEQILAQMPVGQAQAGNNHPV